MLILRLSAKLLVPNVNLHIAEDAMDIGYPQGVRYHFRSVEVIF